MHHERGTMSVTRKHSGLPAIVAVAAAALLATGVVPAQVVESAIPGDPVTIDSGRVAGKLLPSGVRAYFGIPYAAAPTQDLRWQDPQPVRAWQGVFNADRFAPECTQILRPHNINHYFGEEATSEDCLYLNIWAPPTSLQSGRPVMVWLHGGGFSIGSASMPNYGGENLAKKGVVYVSIAYRLGALGFMAHPELTASSPHKASGNYGHLDQVAALRWIQRNIDRFGGDPSRVTLIGQSAGAASAFALQASPLGKGLFHRIVGMSGGGLRAGSDPQTQAEAEKSGVELQQVLKVHSLAELRNVPADRILAMQAEFQLGASGGPVRFRPSLDAWFMPRSPREVFAAGQQNDVPLLLGFTRDESSNDLRTATTADAYMAAARRYFSEHSNEFLHLYPITAGVRAMGAAAARDGGMATSMRTWALGQLAKGRAPIYLYMYAHPHPYAPGAVFADLDPQTAGAYHTSEVPYFLLTQDVYNRMRRTRDWQEYDRWLANVMSDAIVAFAASGDPGTSSLRFPAFERRHERLVEFGDEVRVVSFDKARMTLFEQMNLPGAVGPATSPRTPRD
jgi:para-nitrobenzyl esterase